MSEVNDRAMLKLYRDEARKIATTLGLDDFDEFKDIREAIRELQAQLDSERTLHPAGRCGCHGEGQCQFCRMCAAQLEAEELQAQLERAKAESKDWHEELTRTCKRRDAWARDNDELKEQVARLQADRATEPRADANARQTWAELQRLRRVLLSFGRDSLGKDDFYGPEDVLSEAWQELGRLRNRDKTLGRIATALGMEYVSDNTISDNRDLRVYRAVMELKEAKPQEPRPMSEAPQRQGAQIMMVHRARRDGDAWNQWEVLGWLPTSSGEPVGCDYQPRPNAANTGHVWTCRTCQHTSFVLPSDMACPGATTSSGGEESSDG